VRAGKPDGDVTPWDEIRFPFDPALRGYDDLSSVPVRRLSGEGPEIEERYRCSAAGTFEVTLTVLSDGFSRSYRMARRTGERLSDADHTVDPHDSARGGFGLHP